MTELYPQPLLQGVPEKANVLILNVQYVRPQKLEPGKYSPDYLYIVYRDNDTMKKKLQIITNPMTDIYTTKKEFMNDFKTQREAIPFDKIDKHHVLYKDKERILLKMLNDNLLSDRDKMIKLSIDRAMELGHYSMRKEVHKWRHAYYSDYEIQEYVHTSAYLHYDPKVFKLAKAYLDIEADVDGASKAETEIGACPISAITIIYDYDNNNLLNKDYKPKVFTYLLQNHTRYKDQEYMENHLDKFMDRVHEDFDEKYGKADYKICFYDDEIQMLYDVFKIQHMLKPDFCLIWNMSFDILYIQKRITYLGFKPESFFCHSDFKNVYMNYKLDTRYQNDFKNRGDAFNCLSYTKYADDMLLYAARRKGRQDYGSSGLDNIARIELKAHKRRFSKRGTNTINAAIREYENFSLYNINDTWLQCGIERRVGDIDDLFMRAYECGCRVDKVNRMTVSLKTLWDISHFEQSYVMGNNLNTNNAEYGSDDEGVDIDLSEAQLKGALVGNPTNLNHTGAVIFDE